VCKIYEGRTIGKRVPMNLYNKKEKLAPDLRIRRDKYIFIMFPPFDGFRGLEGFLQGFF
jgi:hypothetical protein